MYLIQYDAAAATCEKNQTIKFIVQVRQQCAIRAVDELLSHCRGYPGPLGETGALP